MLKMGVLELSHGGARREATVGWVPSKERRERRRRVHLGCGGKYNAVINRRCHVARVGWRMGTGDTRRYILII